MSGRDFDNWLNGFKESISGYSFYVDFGKVVENAEKNKIELNMMNALIGSKTIRTEFIELATKYPQVLKCIPQLIAVRSDEIFVKDGELDLKFNFKKPNYTIEQYADFMKKIGLFDMISNHCVASLYDYVLGIETGLDSNARKNRGGHQMEDLVESYLKKAGLKYHKEMYSYEIEKKYGLDLSALSNSGEATKRFDFVIEAKDEVIGIETNFYSSGGSKLNETARSYKMLTEESKGIKGFRFMWITDGQGWDSARKNLKETFDVLDDLYNIKDLESGMLNNLK